MADTSARSTARRRDAMLRVRRFGAAAALRIERFWPLIVPLLIVVAAFLALAWFGVFRGAGDVARISILAALAIATAMALLPLRHYRGPTADEIDRRLERENALEHQPLSSQSDTIPDDADPFARALWEEHRKRMRDRIARLGGASPRAGMPARDPWAIRALVPLTLLVAFAFSFGSLGGRVADAFSPPRTMSEAVAARLDAWVTPPDYTRVAPIFLTGEGSSDAVRTVPQNSVLTLRVTDEGGEPVVERVDANGTTEPIAAMAEGSRDANGAVFETVIEEPGSVRVTIAGGAREFAFDVVPDETPRVAWRENAEGEAHEVASSGALTLHYTAADDYGLRGGTARFAPVGMDGSRPLYDAPELPLAMPRASAQSEAARTSRDLTEHPFAGAVVDVTLEATDALDQMAATAPRRIVMPERTFRNPLALAVLDQRRALAMNANEVPRVLGNLDLLMLHADETIDNTAHFLGLSSARGRVANAFNDDMLREAVDALWELARGIEDGAVSSAERRLRDAQDALAEALENGATDEQLAELMQELREAMQEFMQAMAERMQQMPQQAMPMMPNAQVMTQEDIDRMLENMEQMARNGDRENAQAMLDQLRQMMDQLQAGTPQQGQQQQQMSEMQQQMQEMGDLLREQQELMDETFRMEGSRPPPDMSRPDDGEQRFGENQPRQSPDQSPMPSPPQIGPQPGQQPQQQGENQQGEQQSGGQLPQAGEPMTPEQFAEAMEQLRQRQEALQQRLQEMQEAMEGMGLEPGEQFADAGEAMGDAEGELGEGQSGPAVDDQDRAIQALREGAQNMMQQMMQAMQQGQGQGQGMQQPGMGMMPMQPGQGQQQGQGRADPFGQGFGQSRADRDPLGRPRATQGPQFGDEIEVPDEIDVQTARRILEAIRERLGEQLTPKLEREYLERLLELR